MNLRLYRISQSQKVSYNCIASAIVVAKVWVHHHVDCWDNRHPIENTYNFQWVNPGNVKVEEIGSASSNLEEGDVLCIQYYN